MAKQEYLSQLSSNSSGSFISHKAKGALQTHRHLEEKGCNLNLKNIDLLS